MMENKIGARIELIKGIEHGKKGDKGIIGQKGEYVGIMLDRYPGKLIIRNGGKPISNFLKFVEDERLKQRSLFGESD